MSSTTSSGQGIPVSRDVLAGLPVVADSPGVVRGVDGGGEKARRGRPRLTRADRSGAGWWNVCDMRSESRPITQLGLSEVGVSLKLCHVGEDHLIAELVLVLREEIGNEISIPSQNG